MASFAKAFGVPVAFVAGTEDHINQLRRKAPSLVHSSPQAIPIVAAALAALKLNATSGDRLRRRRIWPVLQLHPPDYPDGAVVRFILTAVHSFRDVDTAVIAILDCL